MICGDSRILRINLQSSTSDSFQKDESWISTAELTFFMKNQKTQRSFL
ncbi:hypothetical protein LEP1GSC051_0511 [Leptospira sp. P2653]|nr:hypothetical protein LEP1GSC051_0511 [Leptospira sp. P2653]